MTVDDAKLLEGYRNGSRTDFATLVERHAHDIFAFLARLVGPRAAEPLTQKTFAMVYASPDAFRGDRPFRVWLMGLAVRAAAIHAGFEGAWDRVPKGPNLETKKLVKPDLSSGAQDVGRLVAQVVSELPFPQRVVLVLKAYRNFTVPEISATLETSGDNVAQLLVAAYGSYITRLSRRGAR